MTAMSEARAVPNRIKELRQSEGIKRPELAVRLGVDPTTVWRWETRRASIPDPAKIAMTEIFHTSLDWLMCVESNGDVERAA
jgi:transcriptional regulator with XRE-family HTH domain